MADSVLGGACCAGSMEGVRPDVPDCVAHSAQRKGRTTQTTTGDNDDGHGKLAKTMAQVVDSGAMTEGHMLDPREMTGAVFPDGARFHYRSCCVVMGKGRQARQLTACQICLRCSH